VQWVVTLTECARMARQLAVGRVFFLGGLLLLIHIVAWFGVMFFDGAPLGFFGGLSNAWAHMVIFPLAACILLLTFVLPREDPNKQMQYETLSNAQERQCLSFARQPQNVAFGVVLLALVLPATLYRAWIEGYSPTPLTSDKFVVMGYNIFQGYDTKGNFNGRCFADAMVVPEVNASAMVVVVPEVREVRRAQLTKAALRSIDNPPARAIRFRRATPCICRRAIATFWSTPVP
jgi:hypothetical protein